MTKTSNPGMSFESDYGVDLCINRKNFLSSPSEDNLASYIMACEKFINYTKKDPISKLEKRECIEALSFLGFLKNLKNKNGYQEVLSKLEKQSNSLQAVEEALEKITLN